MKKILLLGASALIAGSLMTGCGFFDKANGIILYGEEQQITKSVNREKPDLVEEQQFSIKLMEQEGKRVVVLSKDTAQSLIDKKLINNIVSAETTEPIAALPAIVEGKPLLYAKESSEQISVGKDLSVAYEGNKIIGDGRSYVDMLLIVDNADWPTIDEPEKMLAVMEYSKDPSGKMGGFDAYGSQLVQIGE